MMRERMVASGISLRRRSNRLAGWRTWRQGATDLLAGAKHLDIDVGGSTPSMRARLSRAIQPWLGESTTLAGVAQTLTGQGGQRVMVDALAQRNDFAGPRAHPGWRVLLFWLSRKSNCKSWASSKPSGGLTLRGVQRFALNKLPHPAADAHAIAIRQGVNALHAVKQPLVFVAIQIDLWVIGAGQQVFIWSQHIYLLGSSTANRHTRMARPNP